MQEDKSAEANSLKESGIRMFRFGEYEEATDLFQNAYNLYEELGDERSRAEMLNNLGAVHTQEEQWDKATEAFNDAMAAFKSLEDLDGQAQTLGNLGTMYRYQGDTEAAVQHLRQASDLFHEIGDRDKEAATLHLLSRIRLGQARWLEAIHFYDLGLACAEPPGIKERVLRRLVQIPYSILSRPQ
jgi:tetratricopeptide (TPR) repeat protein